MAGSVLRAGDRVAFEARPGCWISGLVAAVRGDGMAEIERGTERWIVREGDLTRVRR